MDTTRQQVPRLLGTCFNLAEVNLTFLESVRDRGEDLGQAGAFQLVDFRLTAMNIGTLRHLLRCK